MQMQNLQYIKNLTVDTAKYNISSENQQVELLVNYTENSYKVVTDNTITDENFREEIEKFAQGLLSRKHGVNLAKREQLV